MKDYRNKKYPEHDRTSCSDENLANADPDGSGCRRCNALLFNRYEELLEEVQALHALRKDAERYRYIKKGNQWIIAATQTGVQIAGEELDDLIDNEIGEEGNGIND